jgi:ATP-dependent Lon protease
MLFKKSPETTEATEPLADLKARLQQADLPDAAREAAAREIGALEKMESSQAEYPIGLAYLDFILSLPWNKFTDDNSDIVRVRQVLERRHYGLEQVKERVVEYLAAKTLRSLKPRRVLVVDDEEIARANLEHVFTKEGYLVETAADGLEALARLKKTPADIVISDLKMSRMDGLQLLAQVR